MQWCGDAKDNVDVAIRKMAHAPVHETLLMRPMSTMFQGDFTKLSSVRDLYRGALY